MAHAHHDPHDHVEVVEGGAQYGSGLVIALITLLVLAILAFALIYARPWGSGSSHTNNNPGISDNSGENGGSGGGSSDGGGSTGG